MSGRPRRIQLRRTRGWRKPEGVVVVSRPSRWGNPYRVERVGPVWNVLHEGRTLAACDSLRQARVEAVQLFERDLASTLSGSDGHAAEDALRERLAALAGREVACWCPVGEPCHGDVLLTLANT